MKQANAKIAADFELSLNIICFCFFIINLSSRYESYRVALRHLEQARTCHTVLADRWKEEC